MINNNGESEGNNWICIGGWLWLVGDENREQQEEDEDAMFALHFLHYLLSVK